MKALLQDYMAGLPEGDDPYVPGTDPDAEVAAVDAVLTWLRGRWGPRVPAVGDAAHLKAALRERAGGSEKAQSESMGIGKRPRPVTVRSRHKARSDAEKQPDTAGG